MFFVPGAFPPRPASLVVPSGTRESLRSSRAAYEDFLTVDALYHGRPLNERMQSRLNRLVDLGIVEQAGRGSHVLARSLFAPTGGSGERAGRSGLDRDADKELLLKHISRNKEVGTPFKELQRILPGLGRYRIQALLNSLRRDGKALCKGRTSAARWFSAD